MNLPKLINDLTQALHSVTNSVVQLEQQGPRFLNILDDIVPNVWVNDSQVTSGAARNGRQNMYRIFSIFQDIRPKSTLIYSALTSLSSTGHSRSIDVNVANY